MNLYKSSLIIFFVVVSMSCGSNDPDVDAAFQHTNAVHDNIVNSMSYDLQSKTIFVNATMAERDSIWTPSHLANSLALTAYSQLRAKKDVENVEITLEELELQGIGRSNLMSAALAKTYTFPTDSLVVETIE